MNTIESAANPEKKNPQQDGPTLRVFVREGNGYALQHETKDFQQAMKQAERFYDKGKDILVNEKDNPNVVHAKSNLNREVDVGREIRPTGPGDTLVKGAGEVVLASFYAKLPLDTKAFDERVTKEPSRPIPTPAGLETSKDPAKGLDGTSTRDVPSQPNKPAGEPSERVEGKEPKAKDVAEPFTATKAVMDKVGYTLPETVASEYKVKDGKFHDKASDALRFEDHGKKLSTPVEDPKVIAHMVEVASAKNWGALELKGTDNFKQIAWLEAQSRGIETKGYQPTERDKEQLGKVMVERGLAGKEVAAPSSPGKTNEIVGVNQPAVDDPKFRAQVQGLADVTAKLDAKPAAGPVKFSDDPKPTLPKVGVELPKGQAPEPSHVKEASSSKPADRTLTKDEQMRVDVATKLMEKQLAKLPEHSRLDAIAKMTTAVRDGTLKIPTPKVTERAVDRPAPAPTPVMERSR
jgi:hypothetical protein